MKAKWHSKGNIIALHVVCARYVCTPDSQKPVELTWHGHGEVDGGAQGVSRVLLVLNVRVSHDAHPVVEAGRPLAVKHGEGDVSFPCVDRQGSDKDQTPYLQMAPD